MPPKNYISKEEKRAMKLTQEYLNDRKVKEQLPGNIKASEGGIEQTLLITQNIANGPLQKGNIIKVCMVHDSWGKIYSCSTLIKTSNGSVYDPKQFMWAYDFINNIDWSTQQFFVKIEDIPYKEGQPVFYKKYPDNKASVWIITHINLAESTLVIDNVNTKEEMIVYYEDIIEKAKLYYFINSRGQIQSTYEKLDLARDNWTKITNNHFDTYIEAKQYYDQIKNK